MTSLIELCRVCSSPKDDHPYIHTFVGEGDSMQLSHDDRRADDASPNTGDAQGRVRIPTSGDPVLRMALIRRGVISVEDINSVEAELKATGAAGYEPPDPVD